MKTIKEFLSYLCSLDVKLWVEGDRLRRSAPKETLTSALKAQLQERKAEILTFLNQVSLASRSIVEPILPVSRDQNLPLSYSQERMCVLDHSAFNLYNTTRLTGELNLGRSLKIKYQPLFVNSSAHTDIRCKKAGILFPGKCLSSIRANY